MPSAARLLYGFFCEHCRLEANGQVTAIGLWGKECKFDTAPPIVMPSLGFHAYLYNPDQVPLSGVAEFILPGMANTPSMPLEITPEPWTSGHNINLGIGNIPISAPGTIKLRLRLNADPPIDEEFSLDVKFAR